MLKIHYYVLNRNFYLVLMLMFIILPILFYNIKYIAEHYIAISIDKIIINFKISTIIASTALIPFANGAPDIMVAITSSSKKEGFHLTLGSILGALIFALSIISSGVIFYSK